MTHVNGQALGVAPEQIRGLLCDQVPGQDRASAGSV